MSIIDVSMQRGPLERWHQSAGAKMSSQLVTTYSASEPVALGITDLTALPRLGFKGADTVSWLQSQSLTLPDAPNTALIDSGQLILRLSDTEFLLALTELEQTEQASKLSKLRDAWSMALPERTYLLERSHSHCCFAITGEQASGMLAKVCGIDLRASKFAQLAIAQTSLARLNAVILALPRADQFLIFADMSSAEYLWECLLDAMQEFNGGPLSYPHYLERINS